MTHLVLRRRWQSRDAAEDAESTGDRVVACAQAEQAQLPRSNGEVVAKFGVGIGV